MFCERRMRWPIRMPAVGGGFQIGISRRLMSEHRPEIEIPRARFDKRRDAGGSYRVWFCSEDAVL